MALLDQEALVCLEQVELTEEAEESRRLVVIDDGEHGVAGGDHPVCCFAQCLTGPCDEWAACRGAGGGCAVLRGANVGEREHSEEALVVVEDRVEALAA